MTKKFRMPMTLEACVYVKDNLDAINEGRVFRTEVEEEIKYLTTDEAKAIWNATEDAKIEEIMKKAGIQPTSSNFAILKYHEGLHALADKKRNEGETK